MSKFHSSTDEPFFETRTQGGWEEPEREIVSAIVLPNGDELGVNDEVLVDADAAGLDVEPSEFTVTVEFGSWIEFQEVELASWEPRFETRLSEDEFRAAWSDWLTLPPE
jgi:hypothetical protein